MKAVGLLCVVVVVCSAATTTHKPHATHEPSEKKNMLFIYSPKTHSMIIKVNGGVMCIVNPLPPAEQISVHTDQGIRDIEIRIIASMYTAVKVDDPSTLNHIDVKMCGHTYNNKTMTYYKL